jgi:hypothetical protein
MASRTILLPARSKTKIPVNCMEQGRWHSVGEQFAPSPMHSPSKVRRHNRRREAEQARVGMVADPSALRESQGQVWSEIEHMSMDFGESSATGALNEVAHRKGHDMQSWAASFPALSGQVGILAFIGADPLGLDVVGDATLYSRLHDRLIGGYIQDALRVRRANGGPDPEAVQAFLGGVRMANRMEAPTVGSGIYRVLTGEVTGGELEDEDRTVHLSAFPAETESNQAGTGETGITPLASPSRRRRIR